ncbi:hypothetical protein FQR65_LT00705 [Abscondita terminalis]|nr:hypothetical protein FQR65_LT00705 [Abscondita terminalis]
MAGIPEVYRTFVDEVIENCSVLFSEDNICDSVILQLKELWLSKLESANEEFVDLNLVQPDSTRMLSTADDRKMVPQKTRKPSQPVNKKSIKIKESLAENSSAIVQRKKMVPQKTRKIIRSINKKSLKVKEIPCNKSMPKLDDEDTYESLDIDILKHRLAVKLNCSVRPKKKLGFTQIKKLIKTPTKKVIRKRITKQQTTKKLKTEVVKNNNIQVSSHTVTTVESSDTMKPQTIFETNVREKENNIVLQHDVAKTNSNHCMTQEYNYIFKNNGCTYKDKLGCTRVKIILPRRTGYSIEQRTCIVTAPYWTLRESKLPKLVSPLIKEITNLTRSDATSVLQKHINTYNVLLQVDGNGVKVNLKSCGKHVAILKHTIKDSSDVDSNDDVTDEEDCNTVFESKNQIMCLYNVVKHTNFIWKLVLHHGIVKINNKVFMFKSAEGTVEW